MRGKQERGWGNYSTMPLPTILFWIFFTLDLYKTQKGILPNASNEGNPITRYLYKRSLIWLHYFVNLFYGVVITLLIWIGGEMGLWIGYSAFVYNLMGFLSWTKWNKWKQATNQSKWWILLAILVITLIGGYFLALLHKFIGAQR